MPLALSRRLTESLGWAPFPIKSRTRSSFRLIVEGSVWGLYWPTISMKFVKAKDVLAALPPDTKRVTPEDRRQEIAMRQRHVVKRYRVF